MPHKSPEAARAWRRQWWASRADMRVELEQHMTRTDFVKGYAQRSGVSDEWAGLGVIDLAARKGFVQ